ncbi:MAG: hypothetical protein GYB66_08280 [Chloroflexi bacterium]|nr:hypothetical protein [Chloroflexota bacterium]
MHILLIFLDGIGLGENDPATNPFAVAKLPTLHALAGGQRWLRTTPPTETEHGFFVPTDAQLGIAGRPQSATGQATILTGRNIPVILGRHYGPKPTAEIRDLIAEDNIFKRLVSHGMRATLINPFPPAFFERLERGKSLPSSIQYAVLSADIKLLTEAAYYAGQAVSPDWTGEGWTQFLGYTDAPTYSPQEAGHLLAKLAAERHLTFFSTWITDELGHRGPFAHAVQFLERTDGVMAGLLEAWDMQNGLIIVTSDHGNMERQGDRRHTENPVPTVIVGAAAHVFADQLTTLADIAPAVLRYFNLNLA